MVKVCPKCRSDKINPAGMGYTCGNCGAAFGGLSELKDGTFVDRITNAFRGAKSSISSSSAVQSAGGRIREELGKEYRRLRPPEAGRILIFILIALFITFFPFMQLNPEVKIGILFAFFIIYGALFLLSTESRMFCGFISLLIIAILFLTQTVLGQSVAEQVGIAEAIDEAVKGVKYTGCYLNNAFNVNVLSTGNLNEFCYKQVYPQQVEKEGCKDCLTFTPSAKSSGIPLRPTTVEVTLSLQKDSNAPAKNIVVKVVDMDSGIEGVTINKKCTNENPCKLMVGDPELVTRMSLVLPCKNSIEYKTIVSYDYVVQGHAEFRIKQGQYATTKLTEAVVGGSSSSGPLSFGIKSDSLEYIVGEDRDVYVNFYLYNEGKGVVKPKKTTVTQIPPRGLEPLELTDCQGMVKVTPVDKTHFDIESYGSIPSNGGELVQCHFLLPTSVTVPYLTYRFEGVTEYRYTQEKKDTMFIDLINYPCKIFGTHWRFISGSAPSNWYSSDFDDAAWSFVDLPDKDWIDSDRYYRKTLVWMKDLGSAWLNVSSDDGAECYVNGKMVFNDIGSTHGHGKKNCGPLYGQGLTGCDYWDYRNDVTGSLQEGNNLIACHVHNTGDKGWFEIQ